MGVDVRGFVNWPAADLADCSEDIALTNSETYTARSMRSNKSARPPLPSSRTCRL
jgi:hypothetical protein